MQHGVSQSTKRTRCVNKPRVHPSEGPPLRDLAAFDDQGLIARWAQSRLNHSEELVSVSMDLQEKPIQRNRSRETDTWEVTPRIGHLGIDNWEQNARHAPISISKTPSSVRAASSFVSKKTDTPKNVNAINLQPQAAGSRGMVITRQHILRCLLQHFPHPATRSLLYGIDNSLP